MGEWYDKASKEAKEQYDKPVDWFKDNVRCCYNCIHWMKSPYLMGDYAMNTCRYDGGTSNELRMVHWDAICNKYAGWKKEDNLLDYAYLKRTEDGELIREKE